MVAVERFAHCRHGPRRIPLQYPESIITVRLSILCSANRNRFLASIIPKAAYLAKTGYLIVSLTSICHQSRFNFSENQTFLNNHEVWNAQFDKVFGSYPKIYFYFHQ